MNRKALLLGLLKRTTQPAELVTSRGASGRFAAFPPCRVAVVASRRPVSPFLQKVLDQLGKAGAQVTRLAVVEGEPTPSSTMELGRELRGLDVEWIVAVGGGRIIDSAKLAWAVGEDSSLDLTHVAPGAIEFSNSGRRLAAVPTMAGAGAEASIAAVLVVGKRKIPLLSHHWVPSLVVLDPEAIKEMPRPLMVETALDAVAHAIESFVSRIEHPIAQRHGVEALRILLEAIPTAIEFPGNTKALDALQYGAYLAGLAQSAASTCLAHALSHSVGSIFGIPHARATATMLLPSISINCELGSGQAIARYNTLAQAACGFDVNDLCKIISRLASHASIPTTLASLIGRPLNESDLERIATLVASDPSLRTNPVTLTRQDILRTLASIA